MRSRKPIALLICAFMLLVMIPTQAFAAGGAVTGKVTDAATRAILPATNIKVSGAGGTYNAVTGSTGTYTVSGIPAGSYTVTCSKVGYSTATSTATVVVGRSVKVNFALTPAPVLLGGVSGTVKNATGAAVVGATVRSSDGALSAVTGSTGGYTFNGLSVGNYAFTVSADGYTPASASVSVAANVTSKLDFTLTVAKPITRHETTHVFSINDVQGDFAATKFGAAALDMANPVVGADGLTYYGIDSDFGFSAQDYIGWTARSMDGVYDDGTIANVTDSAGKVIGIKATTPKPAQWKVAVPLTGEWTKDPVTGDVVKQCTEHYLVMEHWLNTPGAPALVYGTDYRARFKDDGKNLYMWGDMNSEPTDVRLYARMPLPDEWKTAGADYKVTSAKLVVTHLTSESPNDQIRPEDIENENATGVLPQYKVNADGSWSSTVDAYEGDGHFLPAGTQMRMAQPMLIPNVDEFGQPRIDYYGVPRLTPEVVYNTAAWYTTLDRDPFAGSNPRWRLRGAIFGQDLPGVSIPQYKVGEYSTVTIDLLAPMTDAVTGARVPSALTSSVNWKAYMDDSDGVIDGKTINGCPLTADFDLHQYVKGTTRGQVVYSAKLIVDYENASGGTVPTGSDVAIAGLVVPAKAKIGTANGISIDIKNNVPGAVSGTLTLVGTDLKGKTYPFSAPFTTKADCSSTRYNFSWQAPGYGTTVTWKVTATTTGDTDLANNTATATTKVSK